MTDPVKLLSDDEVAGIEARRWEWTYAEPKNQQTVRLTVAERDALCATVRALRDSHLQSKTHFLICGARIEALESQNTALREQLAQTRTENEQLLRHDADAEPRIIAHCDKGTP